MASVNFKRGLLADLPQALSNGTIYVTTDEGGMYIDTANKRVRLGDFIPVNTISDLPAAGHAYETAVYYVKTGNILARWDATNSRWIQINKSGVVAVANDANNAQGANVVSGISLSTNATGELTLVIQKATVATSESFEQLAATVATHTSDLATLNGGVNTPGSVAKQVADARAALLGNPSTYTTIEALETALAGVKTTADAADARSTANATAIGTAQSDISALQGRMTTAEGKLTTLEGNDQTAGSVAYAVAQEAAARADADDDLQDQIDELDGRLDTAEGEIDTLQSDVSTLQGIVGNSTSGLAAQVAANTNAITTLNGGTNVTGSVAQQVSSAVAGIVNGAPAAYDTLKEIADWIGNNPDGAAAMNTAIQANASDISSLQTRMTIAESDIDALEAALDTANTGLKARMTAAEGAITTLNGNAQTAGSVDYKIAQAIADVNGDISSVESDLSSLTTRVSTAEGKLTTLEGADTVPGSVAYQVKAEATRAQGVESGLDTRLTAAEGEIDTLQSDVSSINSLLTWVEF